MALQARRLRFGDRKIYLFVLAIDPQQESGGKKMYQRLFHEMLEGFALHEVVLDRESALPLDYVFLEVNPEFERLTRKGKEVLVGRTVLESFPSIAPEWMRRYGEVYSTGVPLRFEAYSSMLEKHLFLSGFKLDDTKLACLFMEITDRKRTELALRQTDRQLQRLVATLQRSEAALASLVDEKSALLREVHHRSRTTYRSS
jgi:PAS domain-containing protein